METKEGSIPVKTCSFISSTFALYIYFCSYPLRLLCYTCYNKVKEFKGESKEISYEKDGGCSRPTDLIEPRLVFTRCTMTGLSWGTKTSCGQLLKSQSHVVVAAHSVCFFSILCQREDAWDGRRNVHSSCVMYI